MLSTDPEKGESTFLIPRPCNVEKKDGIFELKPSAVVAYADEAARQPAEMLAAQLRPATGFELPVKAGTKGTIVFQTQEDPALGTEGYALRITQYASITAPSPAGLFYGAQTLRQLLPPEIFSPKKVSKDWNIPAVEIRDVPRFGWRGLMLDVSRHFMPKEDVMRLVDTMASLKLNTFHWHLTDDQGWRIEIKKYPKLTEVGAWRAETLEGHLLDEGEKKYDGKRHGGFYTQDDIREVVAHAAERHVVIVPEIDMPGHMQAAIAAYPELGCTTQSLGVKTEWGVCKNILNPEESTVGFCKDVLAETMALFPSEYIHIGGDEADKEQWEASERIQRLREERRLENMAAMQSWFVRQIGDFLRENGRRLVGWDEIAEGGLVENGTIMWWRGEFDGNVGLGIAKEAARHGHDIVVASNRYLYFDESQSEDPQEPLAHAAGVVSLEDVYGFDPVANGLDGETAQCILGVQGQLWTEYIPDMKHVEYMAFPRALALAELAWIPKGKKDYAAFLERVQVQEKRFDAAEINFRKTEQDHSSR